CPKGALPAPVRHTNGASDGLAHGRVRLAPGFGQFVQGRFFPPHGEHQRPSSSSRRRRCSRTCAVVYHLSDFSRRRSSSSLTCGSSGPYFSGSSFGRKYPTTLPCESQTSTDPVSSARRAMVASSRTIRGMTTLQKPGQAI